MRKVLTVSLDKETERCLEKVAKCEKCSKSEVVRRALQKYSPSSQLKGLRRELLPYGENSGYFTDDEIFRDF